MMHRLIAMWMASVLFAGCTTTTPPPIPPSPPPEPPPAVVIPQPDPRPEKPAAPVVIVEPGAAARALDYFNRIRQRPTREQRIELDTLRKTHAGSYSDHDRVRIALLLSLPNTPFADDAQALELLEPLARDTANEYHALAQLMTTLINEHRRLDRQSAALQQKLDRIRALEKEMQQRATTPERKRR